MDYLRPPPRLAPPPPREPPPENPPPERPLLIEPPRLLPPKLLPDEREGVLEKLLEREGMLPEERMLLELDLMLLPEGRMLPELLREVLGVV